MIKDLEEVDLNCHLFEEAIARCFVNSEVTHELPLACLRVGEVITFRAP